MVVHKTAKIPIETVEDFKLLGVIIYKKLNFARHVSKARKEVFKKFYSILQKRLYL